MDNDAHTDIALAVGAITSPVWLHALNEWVTLVAGLVGIVLLVIRIRKAIAERCLRQSY
jgi:hypothetical protein